jgi:DNA-binding response OmpR family regulator
MEIKRGNGSTVTVIPEEREIISGRRKAFFTHSEWEILDYLYQRKGTTVPRDELIKVLWGDEKGTPTRTVDVHISNIRKKLFPIKGIRIDSRYGMGYRLVELSRF